RPIEGFPPLSPQDTEGLVLALMNDEHRRVFAEQGQVDFSYGLPGVGRFRVNAYRQRGTCGAAIRVIPHEIPSVAELGLPPIIETLARKSRGFIVVTGPTGSGKSTTLAAMVDLINSERSCHVMTIEDPIEYLHRHKKAMVNQREIGQDSVSFALALRAALREDPDVILVGEMRDLETMSTAITAAETGHLVLATLHTGDAVQTIDRIIDVYPPCQQQQVRIQLAATLVAVISQQLVPRKDKPGRVPAVEVMVGTPAVRNLIREGKTHQLRSVIQTGARFGMQTMDQSLRQWVEQGVVSLEDALTIAVDQDELKRLIRGA
ncbi:MAG: type IV pilus twitching motility protein PilT, partial [Bacillota bacterium]